MEADLRSVYVGNVCVKKNSIRKKYVDCWFLCRLIIQQQHKNLKIIFMVLDRFIELRFYAINLLDNQKGMKEKE
jgi:hypothetical protein